VNRVRLLDSLCARAWAPLEQEEVDGWVLRAANGFSLRANSVWPRDALGDRPLAERIAAAAGFYRARKLPARFQLSPASQPPDLGESLSRLGYVMHTTTDVMVGPTDAPPPRHEVELLEGISDGWRSVLLGSMPDSADSAGRLAIVEHIGLPRRHALLRFGGEPAAIGLAVADRGWVGIFTMRTQPRHRRRGLASSVLAALLGWGAAAGAREAYLQVEADNAPAVALYRRFGFGREYSYRYSCEPSAAEPSTGR
jgi:GNAT superfamily N-acetyltransferase